MNCANCGAPLPPTSNICTFCQTLNDVDLRAIDVRGASSETSDRICPGCDTTLHHVNIGSGKPLFIDRCPQCLGLFFDNGELEAALHDNVRHVYDIDYQRIQRLSERERRIDASTDVVRYVKCPICRELMHRRAYGTRSGVIVDSCREHGVWLDAGELGQLLKWVKAGGRKLQKQRQEEEERAAERERRARSRGMDQSDLGPRLYPGHHGTIGPLDHALATGVMRLLGRLLGR
jgi:Zn-finger nucleic acid-binding protein